MALIWLAAALAFAILEVVTLGLFALFAMIAALAAALAAYLGADTPIQVVVFAATSAVGLVAARPPLMAYIRRRRAPELQSGAQGMIGLEAPVVEQIGGRHQPGHVRVHGESWPAVADDDNIIPVGATVMIEALRNATLVVRLTKPAPASPAAAPTETAETTTTNEG
jgi:membrane protein implicated in regulation of membrane protease activity